MPPRRRSLDELYHIHKRARALKTGVPAPPPSSPPSPTEPESSTFRIRREVLEEFKQLPEFDDPVVTAGSQFFAEGFYTCRNWIRYLMPLLDLSHVCISTIPHRFRYFPANYLREAEEALVERRAAEAKEAEEEAEDAEQEEALVSESDEEVVSSENEDDEEDEDKGGK